MSNLPSHQLASRTTGPSWLASWPVLVVLLLVEVIAITVAFDAGDIVRRGDWQGGWISQVRNFVAIGIAAMTAVILFGNLRNDEVQHREVQIPVPRGAIPLPFFIGHLAAVVLFVQLTPSVFRGGTGLWSFLCAIAWVIAGLAGVALWAFSLTPLSSFVALAKRSARILGTGAAFGVAAWAAGRLAIMFWRPLGRTTLWGAYHILTLICRDATCDPAESVVGTRRFAVEIAPACSGYEGIGLIWTLLGGYLWCFRHDLRYPRAFLLLPLGTTIMWVANIVRIVSIIGIGTWVSPELALGGAHSQAGWIAFNAVGLGVIVASRRLEFFKSSADRTNDVVSRNQSAALLVPMLLIFATAMVTAIFTKGFDLYYPLRVTTVGIALWCFRRDYAQWDWCWSWPAFGIGVLAFAIWIVLEPTWRESGQTNELAAGLTRLPKWVALTWIAARVGGSVAIVPLAEELAFRGFLSRRLIAADIDDVPVGRFTWPSFVISSFLFGILHTRWLAGTLAGMLFALALYRRSKLSDAVLAHATTNGLIAAYVLATGTWSLWS